MNKIESIITATRNEFQEKEGDISGVLLAILSGENAISIGPDGTDSDLIVFLTEQIKDMNVKRYVLTSSTSVNELSDMRGKMTATVLNEIFNANSAVLNSIMENTNSDDIRVVYGTSRDVPNEDDEMFILYNSFLFRYAASSIKDNAAFLKKISSSAVSKSAERLTSQDILDVRKSALNVEIDELTLSAILAIRDILDKEGIFVSDAKWKKAINAMKIAVAASGRKKVDVSFLPLLQHILWNKTEERRVVRHIVFEKCTPKSMDVSDILVESEELLKLVVESKSAVDEGAGFPRVVYCYDCSESFANLKRLRGHSESCPRHTYSDPNESEKSIQTYKRLTYSELVTLMTSKYRWDIFRSSDPAVKEKFVNEVTELRRRRNTIAKDFESDRKELEKNTENNIWLSADDRADLLVSFDARMKLLNEADELISDIEIMLK